MNQQSTFPESQRDSGLQPKVATKELPWVPDGRFSQPQRGCVQAGHNSKTAATPLGLNPFLSCTQRSPIASGNAGLEDGIPLGFETHEYV